MKICVSIGHCSFEECQAMLAKEDLCELRLDLLPVDDRLPELLSGKHGEIIVTYRAAESETEGEATKRVDTLLHAIGLGVNYVDIDVDTAAEERNFIISHAKSRHAKVILSHHDFKATPEEKTLRILIDHCFEVGADIAKIACRVETHADNAILLGLLTESRPLIVVGMGEMGRIVRIAAPLLGSPFTFASPAVDRATAPGQLDLESLRATYATLSGVGINGMEGA